MRPQTGFTHRAHQCVPGKSGPAAARRLRFDEQRPRTRVRVIDKGVFEGGLGISELNDERLSFAFPVRHHPCAGGAEAIQPVSDVVIGVSVIA
jgi:hypothetical protein